MDRVERALLRIERAVERGAMDAPSAPPPTIVRDDALRAKVSEALAELDQIIREATS